MLIDKPKQYYSTSMFLRLGRLKRFCKGLDSFRFLPTLSSIYISQNMITRWQFIYSFYFSKRTYPQSDKNQNRQYGNLTNNVMQIFLLSGEECAKQNETFRWLCKYNYWRISQKKRVNKSRIGFPLRSAHAANSGSSCVNFDIGAISLQYTFQRKRLSKRFLYYNKPININYSRYYFHKQNLQCILVQAQETSIVIKLICIVF